MADKKRRVLSIDTGSAIVGWAIVDDLGNKLKQIDYGAVTTEKGVDMSLRLKKIYKDLDEIIKKYNPTEAAIESLFYFKNQKTVITVAQARGVIILAAANNNLPVFDYTPLQVKSAVTGYGRAEKKQVQFMVTKIFNLKEIPKPDDVADALAVGVCHLNTVK